MSKSFTHKIAAKACWVLNYITVTLCVGNESVPKIIINDAIIFFS